MANVSVRADTGDQLIATRIEQARGAIRRADFFGGVLAALVGFLTSILIWVVIDQWFINANALWRTVALISVVAITASLLWIKLRPLWGRQVNPEYAALAIEKELPELEHSLVSYQSLRDQRGDSSLKGVVVRSIGAVAARRLNANPDVDGGPTQQWLKLLGVLGIVFTLLAAYTVFSPKNTVDSISRLFLPLARVAPPTRVKIDLVEPGNIEVLEGAAVDVIVHARGVGKNDAAKLQIQTQGEAASSIPLVPGDQPHQFIAKIQGADGIRKPTTYSVSLGDADAGPFSITTQAVPAVSIDEIRLRPPAYTKLPERLVRRGAIEGVEGTEVTLVARTNRPVAKARLELNPDKKNSRRSDPINVRISEEGRTLQAVFFLRGRENDPGGPPMQSYRIQVVDRSGKENPVPVVYPIRVTLDRAPTVQITTPRDWPKEIPVNGQQLIEVRASDPDFGLIETSLDIQFDVRSIAQPELIKSETGIQGEQVCIYRFRPQELGLRAGQRNIRIKATAIDNRHRIASNSLESNVTTTDAIVLHIARPAEINKNDPDGLQPKDQRPAVEPPQPSNRKPGDNEAASEKSAAAEKGTSEGSTSSDPQQQADKNTSNGSSARESHPGDTSGERSNSATNDKNDSSKSGSPTTDSPSSNDGNSGSQTQNASNNSPAGQSSANKPATHDGDAFEKIAEYLREKNGQQSPNDSQQNNTESSNQQNMNSGNDGQQGSNQQGSNQQGSNQQGSNQQGSNQQGSNQQGSNQQGSNQQGSNQQGSNQQGSNQQGSNQQGSNQQGSNQQGSGQQGSGSTRFNQQGSNQQGSGQQGSNQQGSINKGPINKVQDNKVQDNKVQDNKVQDNKVQDNKVQDNKVQDNKAQDNKAQDNKVQDNKVQDNKAQDNKVQDNKARVNKARVNKVQDNKVQVNKVQDNKVQDNKVQDNKARDNKARDNKARVNKARVNKARVNKARVNKARVNKAQVNKARVNKAQVNKAQVNKAQVNKVQDNKVQDNKVQVNKAQVNKARVNKAQVNKAQDNKAQVNKVRVNKVRVNKVQVNKVQDNKVQDNKVQDNKVQDNKVQDNKVQVNKVQVNKVQDNKVQDNKVQDNKVRDNKVQDNKVQDNKVQDNKVQDNKVQDNKVQDNKARDNKARDNKARDNKARDNKARDNKARVNKARVNKARVNKARVNKARVNKVRDNKAQDNSPVALRVANRVAANRVTHRLGPVKVREIVAQARGQERGEVKVGAWDPEAVPIKRE